MGCATQGDEWFMIVGSVVRIRGSQCRRWTRVPSPTNAKGFTYGRKGLHIQTWGPSHMDVKGLTYGDEIAVQTYEY